MISDHDRDPPDPGRPDLRPHVRTGKRPWGHQNHELIGLVQEFTDILLELCAHLDIRLVEERSGSTPRDPLRQLASDPGILARMG
jgi:hypothetical protein